MAYIGFSPAIGEFKKIDDISSQFDGVNTTFTLTAGGSSISIGTAQNLIVSVDGVIQEPGVSYYMANSGTAVEFTEAPGSTSTFFAILLGSVGQVGIPSDDTVSTAKIQDGAITEIKIADGAITAAKIADGTIVDTEIADGAVTTAKIADANVTTAKLAVTGVTAGNYGNATLIPAFTVNVDGRITNASNVEIVGGATLEDNTAADASFYPTMSKTDTGSFTTAVVTTTKLYFNPSTGILNATDFNSLSDATLKTNLQPIEGATNILEKITGFEFDWKDTNRKSAGVMAQDVEAILPHLVSSNKDGTKSVNYGSLTAYLIQCVKELTTRVKELENKNGL